MRAKPTTRTQLSDTAVRFLLGGFPAVDALPAEVDRSSVFGLYAGLRSGATQRLFHRHRPFLLREAARLGLEPAFGRGDAEPRFFGESWRA